MSYPGDSDQNKENQMFPTNNSKHVIKLHSIQTPSNGPSWFWRIHVQCKFTALDTSSNELGA